MSSASKLAKLVSGASEDLPIEKQFVRDFEQSVILSDARETRIPSRTFKPSSLGGCSRNIYFQLMGVTPEKEGASAELIGICESGTDRHIRIQQHIIDMKNYGIDCEYVDVEDFVHSRGLTDIEIVSKSGIETKCYNKKYNISFLTDGLIKYKGQYFILEIKTETSRKYWEHKDTRSEHLAQGVAYYLSFGIDQVMYFYENRDTLNHKAYVTKFTEFIAGGLVEKMADINRCVEMGMVPPKIEDKKKCAYCAYKKECAKYGED